MIDRFSEKEKQELTVDRILNKDILSPYRETNLKMMQCAPDPSDIGGVGKVTRIFVPASLKAYPDGIPDLERHR